MPKNEHRGRGWKAALVTIGAVAVAAAVVYLTIVDPVAVQGAVYTATGCSQMEVDGAVGDAELDTTATTIEVVIPACAATAWTTGVTFDVPSQVTSLIIRGAGSLATVGGGDATWIDSEIVDYSALLQVNLTANTALTHIYGITMSVDPDAVAPMFRSPNGQLRISGTLADNEVKISNVHCSFTYNACIGLFGHPRGVMRNSISDTGGGYTVWLQGTGDGDAEWAADTDFGSESFFFIESNVFNADTDPGNGVEDGSHGMRVVVRYNTMNCASTQNHGTSGDRSRGGRAIEIYGNDASACAGFPFSFFYAESGTAIVWGNNIGSDNYSHFIALQALRRFELNNNDPAPPAGWGACGPSYRAGVIDIAMDGVSVTRVSGPNFDTNWFTATSTQGTVMEITGVGRFIILSITDTDNLTLASSAGTQNDIGYKMGSFWDGNVYEPFGRPCLDTTGMGKGDLLSGAFPDVRNVTNGNADWQTQDAWPRQQLEPLYEWLNTGACTSGFCDWISGITISGENFLQNYNYYKYSANFDGTLTCTGAPVCGMGVGPIASRPMSAVDGMAWWATDEGEWNSDNPGADGKMYIRVSGAWVASYGAFNSDTEAGIGKTAGLPYTYPHPLTDGEAPPAENTGRFMVR